MHPSSPVTLVASPKLQNPNTGNRMSDLCSDKINSAVASIVDVDPPSMDEPTPFPPTPANSVLSIGIASAENTSQEGTRISERANNDSLANQITSNGVKKRSLNKEPTDGISVPKKGNMSVIRDTIATDNPPLASLLKNKYSSKSQGPFIVYVQNNKAIHPLMIDKLLTKLYKNDVVEI